MEFISQGFECILNARNKCPYVDNELVLKMGRNIKLYLSKSGSYRFVMYKNKKPISALQVMSKDKNIGIVANAITIKEERRRGYATRLYNTALSVIPIISHSTNLSEEGRLFSLSTDKHREQYTPCLQLTYTKIHSHENN